MMMMMMMMMMVGGETNEHDHEGSLLNMVPKCLARASSHLVQGLGRLIVSIQKQDTSSSMGT